MSNNIIKYLLIFIPIIIGMSIGRIFGSKWNEKEYKEMKKPELNPPNYIFGIVWPILYLLIGISYSNALYNKLSIKKLTYWIIPMFALIFNYLYTPIFFGHNGLLYGLIVVILSLIFGILTFIQFQFYDNSYWIGKTKTAYLLIPYILWLMFASYLSYNIYVLNKEI
tara:strand:- start:5883 stop:6383 length:501 start_codon:yes stop_codon:yes gene_type:complete